MTLSQPATGKGSGKSQGILSPFSLSRAPHLLRPFPSAGGARGLCVQGRGWAAQSRDGWVLTAQPASCLSRKGLRSPSGPPRLQPRAGTRSKGFSEKLLIDPCLKEADSTELIPFLCPTQGHFHYSARTSNTQHRHFSHPDHVDLCKSPFLGLGRWWATSERKQLRANVRRESCSLAE